MVVLSALLLVSSLLGGAIAASNVIPQGEGVGSDGFFYTVWDMNMQQTFTNRADGGYDLSWSGDGDVVAGKGWEQGSDRNITYSGTYTTGGMSFLMVYGWFKNPLVEYYIMENWDDSSDPSKDTNMEKITTLNTDGSDYDVYKKVQVNWPSIEGTATFDQYRSVRKSRRTGGTVNMGAHFAAWKAKGLQLNDWHYQVVAVEGMQQKTSGSASIKVDKENSNVNAAPAPAPPSSTSAINAPPASSSAAAVIVPESSAPAAPASPVPSSSVVAGGSSADTVPVAPTPTLQETTVAALPSDSAATPSTPSVSHSSASGRFRHGGHRRKHRISRPVSASLSQAAAATGTPSVAVVKAITTTVTWVTAFVTVAATA